MAGGMCLAKSELQRVFHVFGKCGVQDLNHYSNSDSRLGEAECQMEEGLQSPIQMASGGKEEGGKYNERNVYGAGTILLTFILKVWKFILI